ncbi:ABC transporter permease [Nocardioides mangrovicus]|uniref:ABC transporter permease n=1 Tax=Nocardioides mangrovicus TaxID=2478913 RepID=A0A3L8P1H8_9ACTN|nr:ABC transporter permease [Nocardioides mangrovicus]RLV49226.1 ABC transporter permease [Nocardioides mangrovicus]
MPSAIAERTTSGLNPRQASSARVVASTARLGRIGRGVLGVLILALVWEVVPQLGLINDYFLPPLHKVLAAWWEMLGNGELLRNLRASVVRSVAGFSLATAVAIPTGVAIAWYRPVRELLTAPLEVFRNTAALALLPAFSLILGIGETSKIAIVTYACFFPVLLSTVSGVATVDQQLLRSARVLGLGPVATFRKVVFPAAVPTIFTGIRISGAAAILVLIAAELVGATAGLGFLINYTQLNFLIPQMYAAILTTTLLGLAVTYGLVALERRFSRWRA